MLFLFVVFLAVGCDDYGNSKPEKRIGYGASEIYVETVKGHDYIIFDGYYKGGIVHAESCPCRTKEVK